jgi:hypothetical protein
MLSSNKLAYLKLAFDTWLYKYNTVFQRQFSKYTVFKRHIYNVVVSRMLR